VHGLHITWHSSTAVAVGPPIYSLPTAGPAEQHVDTHRSHRDQRSWWVICFPSLSRQCPNDRQPAPQMHRLTRTLLQRHQPEYVYLRALRSLPRGWIPCTLEHPLAPQPGVPSSGLTSSTRPCSPPSYWPPATEHVPITLSFSLSKWPCHCVRLHFARQSVAVAHTGPLLLGCSGHGQCPGAMQSRQRQCSQTMVRTSSGSSTSSQAALLLAAAVVAAGSGSCCS
jgi:hypothetical protein